MADSSIDIEKLIPQRSPFIMVDKLLHADHQSATTSFLIQQTNILLQDGVFNESGLIENIAQTAAAMNGYLSLSKVQQEQIGYIGAIKNLQIYNLPAVNSTIQTTIELINKVMNVDIIHGKITCSGVLLAECEMRVFLDNRINNL